jgi:hypothetical protein
VLGVLSALPIVYFGNCCCLWVIGGGVVAAYVLQSNEQAPITPADGALVGLLAGLAGAVIHFVISIPIDVVIGPWERSFAQRLLEFVNNPQMEETVRRGIEQSEQGGFAALLIHRILVLFAMLFVAGAFSTIGGVLGALMFRKRDLPGTPGTFDAPGI